MRVLYFLVWILALPIMFGHLLWRARRQPEYLGHWRERLGWGPARAGRRPILIHAVSVGETRAAAPLVKALQGQYPDLDILLTHTTPTGRETGQALFGTSVRQAYLPYDFAPLVALFLARTRPACCIVMETELWPEWLLACRRRGIATWLVNARLSQRSARGYRRFRPLIARALKSLAAVAAQTEPDAQRLIQLGAERIQVTRPKAVMAMASTVVLALSLGVYAASRHHRAGDVGVMAASQIGIAVPNFWFAILLILLFSVQLQWFSAGGFPGWSDEDGGGVWEGLKALLLPAVALAVVQAAILARVTRSAVLEVMREDFVRTARAKGLSRRQALWRHVLRNAMIPVVTIMGLQFANLITGTIVVENVFVLPGLGRLVFQAISNRDLVVVRDVVMLLAGLVVVVNFAVDVLYALIDPRLRRGES